MAARDVPETVRRFIARDISTVQQLEVLLLLRGAPEKQWTIEEVARALVWQPHAAGKSLDDLAVRRLVRQQDELFTYSPPDAAAERTVDQLAETYATYKVSVISLIFAKPGEEITLLSDAFRIRRRRRD